MPTYEYRCDHCDRNFDVVQSFHDDPLTRCPTCDSPVRKVFGNVGIVFKGTGFYKTDSRDGAKAKEAPRSEGTESKDGGSPSSDKGPGSTPAPAGGGTTAGEKKAATGSEAGNGKNPAPATSSSS